MNYKEQEIETKEWINDLIITSKLRVEEYKKLLNRLSSVDPNLVHVIQFYFDCHQDVFKALCRKTEKIRLECIDLKCENERLKAEIYN